MSQNTGVHTATLAEHGMATITHPETCTGEWLDCATEYFVEGYGSYGIACELFDEDAEIGAEAQFTMIFSEDGLAAIAEDEDDPDMDDTFGEGLIIEKVG